MNHTIDYWMSQVGDTSSEDVLVKYVYPNVSVGGYSALIGGTPTVTGFLAAARQQSFANWQPEYLAVCVNRYVRFGFKAFP